MHEERERERERAGLTEQFAMHVHSQEHPPNIFVGITVAEDKSSMLILPLVFAPELVAAEGF